MAKFVPAMAPVALFAGVLVGCSNPPPGPKLPPGELPAGVAEVSINGANIARLTSVSCSPEGAATTIVAGTGDAGTTSTVDNAAGLAAQSVEIHDVDGFTGGYWNGLGAAPEVAMNGRAYLITGTAMGYR